VPCFPSREIVNICERKAHVHLLVLSRRRNGSSESDDGSADDEVTGQKLIESEEIEIGAVSGTSTISVE